VSEKTVSVGLRIDGDSRGAITSIDTTEKALQRLDAAGKITLLEGAEQNSRDLAVEIERTRQRVQALETTLSEAYAAGADDQQIKKISMQLDEARREADSFSAAADKNSVSLNRLKLSAREAGIDIANLSNERLKLERLAQSSASLQKSFDSLNIRSAQKIEADILEVNQALLKLAQRADVSGDEFDRAFAAGQKRIEALKAELKTVPDEMGRVGQKADNMLSLFGRLGLAFTGVELARQFVMVNAELENVERSFKAITGSVEQAAAEMDYARGVASRLGLEQISTAKGYASLMVATKGTSVEGEVTRQVFESVARSMSLAGKSAADTEGALLALQQMANKGVISMEELRGQLGERLPGALNAAAEGLGITTAQLIKLTETGQLTAEELFPALAAGLNKLYADGGAETLTQEWNHFKNAVQDAYETIGDAGVIDVLKGSLESMEVAIVTTSTMLVALGKDIGTFFGALANGDIGINGFSENAKRAFAEIEDEARARLVKVAQHNGVMAASLDDLGKAALTSAKQQSTAATQSASDWTKLNVAFGTVKEAGEAATKQAEKNADATKAEGEAAMELANSIGAETDKQLARVDAARQNAAALAAVAERRREELAMATEHVAALEHEAVANGGATEQQQKVIDALKKTAEARQADADKAVAQAAQSQVVAVQAQVEAAAYEQARGSLSRWSAEKQAQLSVDQAVIRLAIEQQQTILAVARAKGDEYGAARAVIEIKRLEIQLAELTAQAKRAEAEATMLAVQARREELQAAGQLTAAKEAELRAQEAGAKVKQVEAQIAGELAKRMREVAEATRFASATAGSSTGGFDAMTGSMNRAADAASRLRKEQSVGSDTRGTNPGVGASGSTLDDPTFDHGSFLDGGHQTSRSVGSMDALYKSGASVEEAKAASKYFGELFQRAVTAGSSQVRSTDDNNALIATASRQAAEEAIRLAKQELATGQAVDLGTSVADLTQRNLAQLSDRNFNGPDASFRAYRDAVSAAGNEAKNQPTKTIRLEIGAGDHRAVVHANSQGDADRFLNVLEAAGMRASQ